ncbi:hypothetical protein KQX54_018862, partial [Cotesia glomerata]
MSKRVGGRIGGESDSRKHQVPDQDLVRSGAWKREGETLFSDECLLRQSVQVRRATYLILLLSLTEFFA